MYTTKNTYHIGVYSVPESLQKTLEPLLLDNIQLKKVIFHNLGEEELLNPKTIKKLDALFTQYNTSFPKPKKLAILKSNAQLLPALANTNQENFIPISLDHFEVCINTVYAQEYGQTEFTNLESLLHFASFLKEKYSSSILAPIFCVGGDDETLFQLIQGVAEACLKDNQHTQIANFLKNSTANAKIEDNSQLMEVLTEIKTWQQKGLLHERWYETNKRDLDYLFSERKAGIVLMPLSDHRQISYKYIRQYTSQFIPSATNKNRELVLPTYGAYVFSTKADFSFLLTNSIQGKISQQTGLSPVTLQAEANDIQSDDVRFWAAASKAMLQGKADLFENNTEASLWAKKIRDFFQAPY